MRVGACVCVYEASDFLAEAVAAVYPLVERVVFLVGTTPWRGPGDPSYPAWTLVTIANLPDPEGKFVTVHRRWGEEATQRNSGSELLGRMGCDWHLILDDDEIYETAALARAIAALESPGLDVLSLWWRIYWKDRATVIDGLVGPMPTFVRTDGVWFHENRQPQGSGRFEVLDPAVAICHHLSYVRDDDQMRRKLERLAPCERAIPDWYDRVWLGWTPSMTDLHPVNPASFPRAVPLAPPPQAAPRERPLLSLAMIVRDEEETLGRCLDSVQGIFDEIIVGDTGSTDRTIAIAREHGAEVAYFPWCNDFAAARNYTFKRATGRWIMWLDADDVVLEADRAKLLELKGRLDQPGCADAYLMPYDYAQDGAGASLCVLYRHRILRNVPELRWDYPIHECLQLPPGWVVATTGITITHRRTAAAAGKDGDRNLRMLEQAVRDRPGDQRLKYYHAKELFYRGHHTEAETVLVAYFRGGDWHDNRINAFYMLGTCRNHLGDHEGAIAAAIDGIKADPRWAELYCVAGQAHYDQAHWGAAVPWFEAALRCPSPASLGSVLLEHYSWIPADRLCQCYWEVGRPADALRAGEQALRARPGDPRLSLNVEVLRDRLFPGRTLGRPIRLNLGAGRKPVPSYRPCDLHPVPGVVEVFDQGEIPYRDGSVQAIYSEHCLEHAASHEAALAALREWARVLRPGGVLHLKVPDLEGCCQEFLNAEDRPRREGEPWSPREWYRYTIYGIQRSLDGEPAEAQHHHTGFTHKSLRWALEASGFAVASIGHYDGWGTPSLEARAVRDVEPIRVRFLVPDRDEDFPTQRIRVLNLDRWLVKLGVDSRVIAGYRHDSELTNRIADADVLVLTHAGEEEARIMDAARDRGVVVILDWAEDVEAPRRGDCLRAATHLTICSTTLAAALRKYGAVTVLPDAYELPHDLVHEAALGNRWPTGRDATVDEVVHEYRPHGTGGKVRVTWCGMAGNMDALEPLRPLLDELGMELVTIHEVKETSTIQWDFGRWLRDLEDTDIVVVPQRHDTHPGKSNNRASQAMALGIPVVVSPLPAYKEFITHGVDGYLCTTPEDWRMHLEALRDQATREHLGRAGREAVRDRFALDTIGAAWLALARRLCREAQDPPACDIVIPTWNNLEYLRVTVESIRAGTPYPHRIIVVNSGTDGTEAWAREQADITLVQSPERLHFSAAINAGLGASKALYVCLLNDDTAPGQGWLNALMHEARKPGMGVVGPFSNCDQGWLHAEEITVAGQTLRPGMTLEEVRGSLDAIRTWQHAKDVHLRDWIAFYCVVLPRAVLEQVGVLDAGFKDGCEDVDLCARVHDRGFEILQTYDSWVFHFGARARHTSEASDHEQYHREDRANHARLARNRAPAGPVVGIYTGPGWEPWGPDSILKGGIGGSETAAIKVAEEFARRGWRTWVFGEYDGAKDGVEYRHHTEFDQASRGRYRLFIASRTLDPFTQHKVQADHRLCWVHDIWLSGPERRPLPAGIVDHYLVLSEWHRGFFAAHHSVPHDRLHLTWNGIDHALFHPATPPPRTPGRLTYSSSPDRGLDVLLGMWPRLQQEAGCTELHVYYGFQNWEKALAVRADSNSRAWLESIRRGLNQPGVVDHGRVGQAELADAFLRSELWLYPTSFTETFGITCLESMAAGVPVVASRLAGLITTAGDAGILLEGDPHSKAYQDRMVLEASRLRTDQHYRERWVAGGLKQAARFTWPAMVDGLLELCGIGDDGAGRNGDAGTACRPQAMECSSHAQ